MAVKNVDVLQANLVLVGIGLINTQEEITAFRRAVETEVLSVEAGVGTEVVNRFHTLNRDRIGVSRVGDRTTINREYPEQAGLERLAMVARTAIDVTNPTGDQLRALGYNVELVYEPDPQEDAIRYLAERLFMPNVLQDEGSRLIGGAARLYFEKGGRGWQVTLEPRLNDEETNRIFASLNLHCPGPDLDVPTGDEILDSFMLAWYEAHDLIDRLDKGATP